MKNTIHQSPERTKASINHCVYTIWGFYVPLHEKAMETAKEIGIVEIKRDKKKNSL